MKRYILYLFTPALLFLMMIGCAQWGGDNPMGITGGGEEGYGKNNDLNLPSASGGIDRDLVGTWRTTGGQYHSYLFTFNADGTFIMEEYYGDYLAANIDGNYSVSGVILTLISLDDYLVYTYFINEDILTLSDGENELVLHRLYPL